MNNRWIKFWQIPAFLALVFVLSGCGNKPNFMKYDVVFYAPLGTNQNEIGSNIPLLDELTSNNNEFLMSDYIDVPTEMRIFRDKIYLADKYNRRISIFPLNINGPVTNTPIMFSNEGYNFGIPFQVALNKYGEIYVVASVSNFKVAMKPEYLTDDVMTAPPANPTTNFNQYYIYKFTADGKFIYQIGENGVHSGPMEYPVRMDIDLFDNVYAYFKEYENDQEYWVVKRFSPSGELSFEFNTKYIAETNKEDNKVFVGIINDVYNLKNDERLMIFSENYIVARNNKPVDTPDEFYNSLDVYSVLQNAITKNIFRTKKYVDEFAGVTKDDILVLHSYDDRFAGIRFRFIDIGNGNKEEMYYAPVLSNHYLPIRFFIDDSGEIYSIIVKDNNRFILLKWRKVKSKDLK